MDKIPINNRKWLIAIDGNVALAIIAPSLPLAEERPWAVERQRVGKTSLGMIN
jgi:hypothetical protein